MRIFLLLILTFGSLLQASAQDCDQIDLVLTSQDEIDRFTTDYPGCSTLGSLRIQEGIPGSIQNLHGLHGLTRIVGDLQIFHNSHLADLNGLNGLTAVGGNLDLFSNDRLASLDGLQKLEAVGGFLDVSFSDYLTNIDALSALSSVGTHLRLFHLYGLHDCKGIASFISALGPLQQQAKVLIGTEGGLPRNGSGANSRAACLNSAEVARNGVPLQGTRPNIILFIMDDVGLDQLAGPFGYGGTAPPPTPSLNQIAAAGITFDNVWAAPECSPSRIALFTGEPPAISETTGALGTMDLANSQLNPYKDTLADQLHRVGYTSAMVGKWHMGGPENNEAELTTPIEAGLDYYYGNVHGFLRSIDTTAGGLAPTGTYNCGFVPNKTTDAEHGADAGACYTNETTCEWLTKGGEIETPGRTCLERGGLFVPAASCASSAPSNLDFTRENAYYVAELDRMSRPALPDAKADVEQSIVRGYRTTIESDEAIAWLKSQSGLNPYFLAISYSAAHTPLQQVPQGFSSIGIRTGADLDCTDPNDQRVLQKATISVMSEEIGRVLRESGLMTASGPGGSLELTPAADNSLIIIIGDNGTLGAAVNLPFDPTRSKGSTYQTGVQVPLIVAGAGVGDVGIQRGSLISITDLYGLILDAAGLPVPENNPPFGPESLAANLLHAEQSAPRGQIAVNFAPNPQIGGAFNPPCNIAGSCTLTPINKGVCEDNNGVWFGPGADGQTDAGTPIPSTGFATCWEANQFLSALYEPPLNVLPIAQYAAATETYKLVQTSWVDYDPETDGPITRDLEELFLITSSEGEPLIDYENANLLADPGGISDSASLALEVLSDTLAAYKASGDFAREDGNRDGVVDDLDLWEALSVSQRWGLSSYYDVNLDGLTDQTDIDSIWNRIGREASSAPALQMSGILVLLVLLGGLLGYRRRTKCANASS